MIGGDSDIVVTVLDHLKHGLEHADNTAVWSVLAFREPAQPVEMTKKFVRAVDEVRNHFQGNVRFRGCVAHFRFKIGI